MADTTVCIRVTDVGAYLLGGLSPEEASAFRAHADSCGACAPEIRALRPVVDQFAATDRTALAGLVRDEPPSALRDRILGHAAAEQVPALRASRPRRRWLPVAAGVIVFGLGAGSGVGLQAALDDEPARSFSWGDGSATRGERVDFVSATAAPLPDPAGGLSDYPGAATVATGPVRAWAWIGSGAAGTYAALYTQGLRVGERYSWWVETASGSRVELGSFVFPPGVEQWLVCPGSTSLPRTELVRIGATDSQGIDVLRSKLPVVTT